MIRYSSKKLIIMSLTENEIIEKALKQFNFKELNPVQKLAIKKGLFKNNMIISAPTASGKTLCAILLGLNSFFNKKGKMLYLCPLVALAQEHYNTFKEKFSSLGIKIALSIGDYDSSDPWLRDYDWIICSNEKADSLIRHGANWIKEINVIVADEIHLLTDLSRGPTLEMLLTRLREMLPKAQILGLSATIKNVNELAEWLNAVPITSDWRPVKLYEGVSFDSTIQFFEKKKYDLNEDLLQEESIVENTLQMKKQALFFVATRRSAEALAEKLTKITKKNLGKNEREYLQKISDRVLNILEIPTKQCKKLAKCIQNGVAFHHSGLLFRQRTIIEDNFRNGLIKVICCTPSLSYGVNLPAFRVIIRDVKRYYTGYGAKYISVLDYKQYCGRCGRPQYDTWGESILIAKSEDEAQELIDYYILGEPEEIQSKLALEPILRMHVLALIASGFINTEYSLLRFFEKTFYTYQYGDISEIESRIQRILKMLIDFGFLVRINEKLIPTKLGKRVSELYIDPLTGYHFVKSLEKATKITRNEFSYLQMVSHTLEMKPLLSVRSKDIEKINEILVKYEKQFLEEIPEEWDESYDEFIKSVKTALVFDDWINEATEDDILSRYNIRPGELRTRLTNIDWLLYSAYELALLLGYKDILKELRKLRVRMKNGIKEELIPLVRLEGIGRIRARKLYSHNLRTIESLRKIPLESLQRIIGTAIAASIKKQLGEKVKEVKEEKQRTLIKTTI